MNRFSFWLTWLKVVGYGLIVFGLLMTFFNGTLVFQPFNQGIDPAFWGSELEDDSVIAFRTWVYGAWGATITGWGITLVIVLHNAFRRGQRWAWYAIAGGLLVWYLLDTGVSAYFRVGFNVIFNTTILALVLVPLLTTYRHFHR